MSKTKPTKPPAPLYQGSALDLQRTAKADKANKYKAGAATLEEVFDDLAVELFWRGLSLKGGV